MLDDGSLQADLWGINLYPSEQTDDWIEFDSMINVRPGKATDPALWKTKCCGPILCGSFVLSSSTNDSATPHVACVGQVGGTVSRRATCQHWQRSRQDLPSARGRPDHQRDHALARALELFDLTASDPHGEAPAGEKCSGRGEYFCDTVFSDRPDPRDAAFLRKYFLQFATAARQGVGRGAFQRQE